MKCSMESQSRQSEAERQLAKNIQANERFAKREYPNEKFISDNIEFQSKNRFTKGLIIPENVKVAESRVPISAEQRRTLFKELRQAGVLARLGNLFVLLLNVPDIGKKLRMRLLMAFLLNLETLKIKSGKLRQGLEKLKKREMMLMFF